MRVRRWLGLVVPAGLTVLALAGAGRLIWPQPAVDVMPGSTSAQLAFVRSAILDGADAEAQRMFPEGYFFTNALYGLAWVQVGRADPSRRVPALQEARWALARIESSAGTAPFSLDLRPAYGIFHAGWTNWLRAGIVSLQPADGRDPDEVLRLRQHSSEIAAAFRSAGTPYLQAYPGESWPVDSTVAVASLRLHDSLLGATYDELVRGWTDQVRARLDPATGLMPHRADPVTGAPQGPARGTSQSIIHRFLAEIDPALAREHYLRFRDRFVDRPLGLGPAVREYPHGTDGDGDVDSGPLVLGVSMSATVVTLGAARVQNDPDLAKALGAEGELLGVPVRQPGSKRYALGALPTGDAFLVWSQTARPLVSPAMAPAAATTGSWRTAWLILLAAIGLLPWLVRFAVSRGRGGPCAGRPGRGGGR